MINHIANLPAAKVAAGVYRVPVFLIHVVAGLNFGMLFAELYGTFGIAFYIETVAL